MQFSHSTVSWKTFFLANFITLVTFNHATIHVSLGISETALFNMQCRQMLLQNEWMWHIGSTHHQVLQSVLLHDIPGEKPYWWDDTGFCLTSLLGPQALKCAHGIC